MTSFLIVASAIEAKKELALSLLLGCYSEMAELEMLKLEPDLDAYYCILESDECSRANVHIFQNSAISSPSYPSLVATYRRSDMCTNLQLGGGRRGMDTPYIWQLWSDWTLIWIS